MTKGGLAPLPSKFAAIRFRFDSRLAMKMHSLARYSERTMQPLKAASSYTYYVSDLCTVFLGLLFNFPSRY